MSIEPKYAESILNGTKRFEYRKKTCKNKVGTIIIYATRPVKRVVGKVNFTDIIEGAPNNVWKKTKAHSGITKDFFDSYYAGKTKAFAYVLGEFTPYNPPKTLSDFGIAHAPQSVVRIKQNIS